LNLIAHQQRFISRFTFAILASYLRHQGFWCLFNCVMHQSYLTMIFLPY